MYAKDGEPDEQGTILFGYLDAGHQFPTGPVSEEAIAELEHLDASTTLLTAGLHFCDFCPPGPRGGRPGSDHDIAFEVDGRRYQSPAMITHYIREHGYCPPGEYLDLLRRHREERRAPG